MISATTRNNTSSLIRGTNVQLSIQSIDLFLVADRKISAGIDFPDWGNNSSNVPILERHQSLPPHSISSISVSARHRRSRDSLLEAYPSFLCVTTCIKSRGNDRSSIQKHSVMTAVEQHPGDQWWNQRYVGNPGSLCGIRISLEDQYTINNFTGTPTPPSLSPTAELNTPN